MKVAKPQQDMRFDVPVIGIATVEAMRAAGASALSIDAGKTLVFDRTAVVAAAENGQPTTITKNTDQIAKTLAIRVNDQEFLLAVVASLLFFASIVLHELGHVVDAALLSDATDVPVITPSLAVASRWVACCSRWAPSSSASA